MKLRAKFCSILLLLAVAGCGEDTAVRTYSVAKSLSSSADQQASIAPAQTLGVILPHNDTAWFLKLMDDPAKVEPLTNDFRKLASSIRFDEQGRPMWNLVEGWNDQVLEQITYAKFTHGDGATATLTTLAANTQDAQQWQAYLKDNVNRWRDQLGLAPQDWPDMARELEEFPDHSKETAKAYFVSLKGTRKGSGMGMGNAPFLDRMRAQQTGDLATGGSTGADSSAPSNSATSAPQASGPQFAPSGKKLELKYQVPELWQELPASGIRLASFQIQQQDQVASVVVSTSTAQIPQVIEMWMQQVGKTPSESQVTEIIQSASSGEVNSATFQCYQLLGEGDQAIAIRAAVVPLKDPTANGNSENLYIKMTGPAALVQAQSPAMDQFVSSITW